MNLNDILKDPTTAELTDEVMKETGIYPDPEKKDAEKENLTVYERRCRAAESLATVIDKMNAAGKEIHASHKDLVSKAVNVAKQLERDHEQDGFTRQVMEAVIAGHIWMGKVGKKPFHIAMARQGAENYIVELIEGVIYQKRSVGFAGCDGNCDCEESCGNCPSGGGHSGNNTASRAPRGPSPPGGYRSSGPAPSSGRSSGGGCGGGCGGCSSGC